MEWLKKATSAPRNASIHLKLTAFLVIIVGALVSFALFSNSVSAGAIVDKAAGQLEREAMLLSQLLDAFFSEALNYSKLISIDASIQDAMRRYEANEDVMPRMNIRSRLSQTVSYYLTSNNIVSDVAIYDMDLKPVYAGESAEPGADALLGRLGMTFGELPVRPVFTPPFLHAVRSRDAIPAIALVKPIVDIDSGRRLGLLAVFLYEEDIALKYAAPSQYMSLVDILDASGMVLSSSDKARLFTKPDTLQGLGGAGTLRDASGIMMIVSGARMERIGFEVLDRVPFQLLTQESTRLNRLLLLFAAGVLLLSVLAAYALSRAVTRPIQSLARAMDATERGSLPGPVEIGSRDEIGRLGSAFNHMTERIKALIAENDCQQRFLRDYEFRLLQSQIKPHFLYNTLETIMTLTQLGMREESIDATSRLARFYRLSLSSGEEIIPIRDEVELVESYLSIQRYRYIEYIGYSIDIDPSILSFQIPKLTLQPLLENAIYHGIKPSGGRGEVKLQGRLDGSDIVITVVDDGVGISPERLATLLEPSGEAGFGLPSVHRRLSMLYGEAYGLEIESRSGLTRMAVRIPALLSV